MIRYKVWKRAVRENEKDKYNSQFLFWTNMFLLPLFSKERDTRKEYFMEQKMMDFGFWYVGFEVPVEYPGNIFLLSVISSDDMWSME